MTDFQPPIVQPVLTNVQVELLKVFAMQLPEDALRELRFVIARFLMERVRDRADKIWEEKGYDENTLTSIVNGDI
jgi:hypothetical protein